MNFATKKGAKECDNIGTETPAAYDKTPSKSNNPSNLITEQIRCTDDNDLVSHRALRSAALIYSLTGE